MSYLDGFRISVKFLTIFNVGTACDVEKPEDIAGSLVFFPIVGGLLGTVCALFYSIAAVWISYNLALSLFPVVVLAVLSRGLHLDGVSDCFDALHYSGDKEWALRVMKGKTIGAFGASALILVIVGKIIAIAAIPEAFIVKVLILVPTLSRWTSSIVGRFSNPATEKGLGFIFASHSTTKTFLLSGYITLAISFLILGTMGFLIFVILSIFAAFLTWFFSRAFGGVTGDVFGATMELSEVFGFLLAGAVLTK